MQQSRRIFSVEEADTLVPFISDAFLEIFRLNEGARALAADINNLLGIWGNEITEPGHIDHGLYSERLEKRSEAYRQMQGLFGEIAKTGAIVKDAESGLVDFYAKKGGETVMLCWKFGEERVKFWHPVAGGFGKRKPVEELGEKKEARF